MSEDHSEDIVDNENELEEDQVAENQVDEQEEVPDEDIVIKTSEYENLVSSNNELREQLMRQQAEFENVRKRLRKTADEAGVRSLARFIRPLLNEMDNFEMAIKAANPEKFTDFAMGVTMIHENLKNVFSSSGVQIVQADGIFDPAFHEVVAEIEQEDCARGQIIEVQRNGYELNGQVIRAAQVIVGKPPEPAQTEAEVSEEAEEIESEDQTTEAEA